MLAFRNTSPCERCVSMTMCAVVRADLAAFVESENRLATLTGKPVPDAEVLWHCHSFCPPSRRRPCASPTS